MITRIVMGVAAALFAAACAGSNPTTPSSTNSPTTVTWSGSVAAGGQSTRSFTVSRAGDVTLSLNSVNLGADRAIGVGIGLADGAGCHLSATGRGSSTALPSVTAAVDEGTYCASIFDAGGIGDGTVGFSLTLTYP